MANLITIVGVVVGFLTAIVVAIVGPMVVARNLRKVASEDRAADSAARIAEKQADWNREDEKERARVEAAAEVARLQAKAATDLAVSQNKIAYAAEETRLQAAKAAELLVESNARSEVITGVIVDKLSSIGVQNDQIHTLVNQKLSDAIERALAATVLLLAAQQEAVERTKAIGETPTQAALDRIERTRAEIRELRETVSNRRGQQDIVDKISQGAIDSGDTGPISALDVSAANLTNSAASLDDAAASLTSAAEAHHDAQVDLEDKTAALDNKEDE